MVETLIMKSIGIVEFEGMTEDSLIGIIRTVLHQVEHIQPQQMHSSLWTIMLPFLI